MRCPQCGRPVLTFRLNPDRARVEPFCPACHISIELPPTRDLERCPSCGMDFATARSLRLLGCEHCYDTFTDALRHMMNRRLPPGFFFERPAPGSLARERMRIFQELYAGKVPEIRPALQEHAEGETSGDSPVPPGLSLRIRLARNIPGIPYPGRMEEQQRMALDEWLFSPGASLPAVLQSLLGVEFVRTQDGLCSSDKRTTAWSGDEDHLRLAKVWHFDSDRQTSIDELEEKILSAVDDFRTFQQGLDQEFFWQARPLFGFLAACPSNTGSGRRMSLQFSTCGLEKKDPSVWLKWVSELRRPGFEIRGGRGEGSTVAGAITLLVPDDSPGNEPDREERARLLSGGLRIYERIRQDCR